MSRESVAAADALIAARHRQAQEKDVLELVGEATDLKLLTELLTGTLDRALRSPSDAEAQNDLARQLNLVLQAAKRIGDVAAGIRDRQART